MPITARCHGLTDRGLVRKVNEDSILVQWPLFVVADGMGGHAGGAVASAIAVDAFRPFAGAGAVDPHTVIDAVAGANAEILRRGSADAGVQGMGTTVVGLAMSRLGTNDSIMLFHVGDSRAYMYRGGVLTQMTSDHSLVADLLSRGEIGPEAARRHPQRNIVTRALGLMPAVDVDIRSIDPKVGDRFLLCSDGLTSEVDFEEIAIVMSTLSDVSSAVEELIARAQVAGAHDNVSVVVVEITAVSSDGTEQIIDVDTVPGRPSP